MKNLPVIPSNKELETPGIGVSGTVMCPIGFTPHPCLKGGCEFWVPLNYGKEKVARCALAWNPVLSTELRESVDKLRLIIENLTKQEMKNNK